MKSYFQVFFGGSPQIQLLQRIWQTGKDIFISVLSAETEDRLRMQEELKDLVEKDFVAFPDVAADVVNALLYDGEPLVNAGDLLPAPTETLYSGSAGTKLRNQYEDLAKYEMRGGWIRAGALLGREALAWVTQSPPAVFQAQPAQKAMAVHR